MKSLAYLLFTTTVVAHDGTPAVSTNVTKLPDKAACVQAVADFVNEGAYKNNGTSGSTTLDVSRVLTMYKTAKCSEIGQGDE